MNHSQMLDDPYQDARIALLRYFNSQCMTHAGYFVSLFVGVMVTFSASEKLVTIPFSLVIYVISIAVLTFGCVYALFGLLYWLTLPQVSYRHP